MSHQTHYRSYRGRITANNCWCNIFSGWKLFQSRSHRSRQLSIPHQIPQLLQIVWSMYIVWPDSTTVTNTVYIISNQYGCDSSSQGITINVPTYLLTINTVNDQNYLSKILWYFSASIYVNSYSFVSTDEFIQEYQHFAAFYSRVELLFLIRTNCPRHTSIASIKFWTHCHITLITFKFPFPRIPQGWLPRINIVEARNANKSATIQSKQIKKKTKSCFFIGLSAKFLSKIRVSISNHMRHWKAEIK